MNELNIMEIKQLSNNDESRMEEWIQLGLLSKPGDIKKFRKELMRSIEHKGDIEYGIPYYIEEDNQVIAVAFAKKQNMTVTVQMA